VITNWSTRPLADEDLAAIRARSPSADTRTLLWEIRRLRALVLRADLLDEPCVEEAKRRKRRWAERGSWAPAAG
jgi:hypothetical protein